jgi:hypothetical protein
VNHQGSPILNLNITDVGRLPAQRSSYPILLMHKDGLGDYARKAVPQIWVRGEPAEVIRRSSRSRCRHWSASRWQ